MITIDDMIEAAERELKMRAQVYPRRVAAGRMTQAQMNRETRTQIAIISILKGLRDGQTPLFKRRPQQGSLPLE